MWWGSQKDEGCKNLSPWGAAMTLSQNRNSPTKQTCGTCQFNDGPMGVFTKKTKNEYIYCSWIEGPILPHCRGKCSAWLEVNHDYAE